MSTAVIALPFSAAREAKNRRRYQLWIQAEQRCHWCGRPTRLTKEICDDQATIDHVVPRWRGGSDDDDNVVLACHHCNNRRNIEDHHKLGEGALLSALAERHPPCKSIKRRFRPEDVLRDQRDQAHKRIAELERDLTAARVELASVTIWKLIRRKFL